MQVKEWNFDKNLSKNDMAILVAKAEQRKRNGGKETAFYCAGQMIRPARLDAFKKRKTAETIDAPSPSATTPVNITYGTPRYENDMDNIEEEEETTFPDNEYRALDQPESRNSISRATVAGAMSIGVSTGSTHSVIPMDIRDITASFDVGMHEVQEDSERHSSPKPPFSNGHVELTESAKTTAIIWPLEMNDRWSSDEKTFYLKRSIQVYGDRHQPARKFICQLALADLTLRWHPLPTQKLVISSLLDFISGIELWGSPPDIHQLDESTLTWLVAMCMQDYQHQDDGQVLRSMIHLIWQELLKDERDASTQVCSRWRLMIMLTSTVMICGRADPLEALTIFDKIIDNTRMGKGGLADVMQANSFIFRALHRHHHRLASKSEKENDLEMAWICVNRIEESKQRDIMRWFWMFTRRTIDF